MKAYKRITSSGGMSIPVGIRRAMGIQCRDAMELEVTEKNELIMRPHQIRCIFCGDLDGMSVWKGKGICRPCLAEIVKGAKSNVTD